MPNMEMQAESLANFLLPMLRYDPASRASAQEMLQDPWLRDDEPPQGSAEDMEELQVPCAGREEADWLIAHTADEHPPRGCREPMSEGVSRMEDIERSERLPKKARYPH